MKKKTLLLITACLFVISGVAYSITSYSNTCPLEGTPDCPKNHCPLKGTPDCPYEKADGKLPSCCVKKTVK